MGNRITYLVQGEALEVHIRMKSHWWLLSFLPLWLAGWVVGLFVVLISLLIEQTKETDTPFLLVWLVFWFFAGALCAYVWVWHAFGKEIVKTEGELLTIKYDIFGWGLTRSFQINGISNLRAIGFFGNMFSWSYSNAMWGISGGTVAFDYRGKTHRFGIWLEEKESSEIVERLKPHLQGTISGDTA